MGWISDAYGSMTARSVARTGRPHSGQSLRTDKPLRLYRQRAQGSEPVSSRARSAPEISWAPVAGSVSEVGSGKQPPGLGHDLARDGNDHRAAILPPPSYQPTKGGPACASRSCGLGTT